MKRFLKQVTACIICDAAIILFCGGLGWLAFEMCTWLHVSRILGATIKVSSWVISVIFGYAIGELEGVWIRNI